MTTTKERVLLIDCLKIMTLLAIAILHANEFVFYQDIFPLGNNSPIWFMFSYYARVFTLGGQILVSIIYLLFGFSGKSRKSLLIISAFALFGQICLALVFQTFEWDIYAFLAVTNILLILPVFYQFNRVVVILSLGFLCLSPQFIQQISPDNTFFVFLTGKITSYNSGSWPLMPWFFLAVLFYQIGLKLRISNFLDFFHRTEYFLWPVCFALSIPFLGLYYWVPIGPRFYEFSFAQPQYIFWANFLIFVFIMRLAFLTTVQSRVRHNQVVNWISHLYWNRHLGLTYLLSIIYLGIGMNFSEQFEFSPWLFDLFFLGLMPISELVGRFLVFIVKLKE